MTVKAADDVEKATGWRPAVIYSIQDDEFRVVTQQDVDELLAIRRAYGELREAFNRVQHDLDGWLKGVAEKHRKTA